jgi:hypothetical protein
MANFREINLASWAQFPSAVAGLAGHRREAQEANSRPLMDPVFRGLGNHEWRLETTLERSADVQMAQTLISYYRRAERSKPAVESLTGKNWAEIPDCAAFEASLQGPTLEWVDSVLEKNPAIYQYLIYLRHHGFPSPLLDWTASPFIAAAFAFEAMDKSAGHVGIYAWFRDTLQSFGADAHSFVVSPYIRTHPRHYLQQSRYSLFLKLRSAQQGDRIDYDYGFVPHHQLIGDARNQDLVVLIRVPTEEYRTVLMELDSMNLNPYSLYGSEDSLIRTIARRELLFK